MCWAVERAGNDLVCGEKDYVGSRCLTHLAADAVVNGVAGDDESERGAGNFRAEEQRLERDLVKPMIAEQVTLVGVRLQQAFQLQLQIMAIRGTGGIVDSGDISGCVYQREQIAAAHLPEFLTSILDRIQIMRGHERLEAREVGKERNFAIKQFLPLALKVLKGDCGVKQIGGEIGADLLL